MKIQGEIIPSITDSSIKCLGKWFNSSLKDIRNVQVVGNQVQKWQKKIEKSELPRKFKAWIYQHSLLPWLAWLFTIYEMPVLTVVAMERKIKSQLRKWFGIPPSFTSIGLYSKTA